MSAIHRDPRNYKDPAKFNPERWQVNMSGLVCRLAPTMLSGLVSHRSLSRNNCLQEGKPAGKGLTFLSVADLGFACSNGAYVVSSPPGLQIQVSNTPHVFVLYGVQYCTFGPHEWHRLPDGKQRSLRNQPSTPLQVSPMDFPSGSAV